MHRPDGRLDPHGPTLRALNRLSKLIAPQHFDEAEPHLQAGKPQSSSSPAPSRAPAPSVPTRPSIPLGTGNPVHKASQSGKRQTPADIVTAAQKSQRRWGPPASVTIAQWQLESHWGKAMPGDSTHPSNNPFGMKAWGSQPYVSSPTHEQLPDGRRIRIIANSHLHVS